MCQYQCSLLARDSGSNKAIRVNAADGHRIPGGGVVRRPNRMVGFPLAKGAGCVAALACSPPDSWRWVWVVLSAKGPTRSSRLCARSLESLRPCSSAGAVTFFPAQSTVEELGGLKNKAHVVRPAVRPARLFVPTGAERLAGPDCTSPLTGQNSRQHRLSTSICRAQTHHNGHATVRRICRLTSSEWSRRFELRTTLLRWLATMKLSDMESCL